MSRDVASREWGYERREGAVVCGFQWLAARKGGMKEKTWPKRRAVALLIECGLLG